MRFFRSSALLLAAVSAFGIAACGDSPTATRDLKTTAPGAPHRSLVPGEQLDQENLSNNTVAGTGGIYFGQSFTAGATGQLSTIAVSITCQYTLPDAVIEVYAGAYDVYGADFASPVVHLTPIASQAVASSQWPSCDPTPFLDPTWQSVTFSSPASVVAGHQYTFRLTCPTCAEGGISHPMSTANPYAGGTAFVWPTYDLVFRTYLVATPADQAYAFTGFFAPLSNLPAVNVVKAGSAIPVKFSLSGNQGLAIFASGSPSSQQVTCDASAPLDQVTETVTAGSSNLAYDATSDSYLYVWKTEKGWANTCRVLTVKLKDNSTHTVRFALK